MFTRLCKIEMQENTHTKKESFLFTGEQMFFYIAMWHISVHLKGQSQSLMHLFDFESLNASYEPCPIRSMHSDRKATSFPVKKLWQTNRPNDRNEGSKESYTSNALNFVSLGCFGCITMSITNDFFSISLLVKFKKKQCDREQARMRKEALTEEDLAAEKV